MVINLVQPHVRYWLDFTSSTSFIWKRSYEEASKHVWCTYKKPTAASSNSFNDLSIFPISTRDLESILKKEMVPSYTTQNTTCGIQIRKHVSSFYGCIRSNHLCTTSLTRRVASVTKLSCHCSAHLLLPSEQFSAEQSTLEQTLSCQHINSQTLLWAVWLEPFYFSEAR